MPEGHCPDLSTTPRTLGCLTRQHGFLTRGAKICSGSTAHSRTDNSVRVPGRSLETGTTNQADSVNVACSWGARQNSARRATVAMDSQEPRTVLLCAPAARDDSAALPEEAASVNTRGALARRALHLLRRPPPPARCSTTPRSARATKLIPTATRNRDRTAMRRSPPPAALIRPRKCTTGRPRAARTGNLLAVSPTEHGSGNGFNRLTRTGRWRYRRMNCRRRW